jgi:alpha-ketoglutarate-dependent taurine dioxygenase
VTFSLSPSSSDSKTSQGFPLVIEAKIETSFVFLAKLLSHNRKWVDMMNLKYGAVLFRGFNIESARDVKIAIQAYEPNLSNQYRGTSPQSAQDGTGYVFSAAEVPSNYSIAQHIEMSFLPSPPRKLFFSALKAPKAKGGETALADFEQVQQDLTKKLREKMATKKILCTRTHNKQGADDSHTMLPVCKAGLMSLQPMTRLRWNGLRVKSIFL